MPDPDRFRALVRDRFRPGRRDGGYTTETVLVIALLAALAIGVVGVISTAVTDKAESIVLE